MVPAQVDADPKHVKARFRLAAAHAGLGRPRKAEAELVACLAEEPYNKDVKKCLADVRARIASKAPG